MSRTTLCALALLGVPGCGVGGFDGQLVDALNGDAPIEGVTLVARAQSQVSMTCQTRTGTTDADGQFTIDGLCLSESAYDLSSSDDTLFLADVDTVPQGGGTLVIKAWHAPLGSGVYQLSGQELTVIPTHSDLKHEVIFNTDEKVLYPKTVPDAPPTIEASDYLVLTGPDNLEKLSLQPMVRTGTRKFGNSDGWVEMEPWWYIGTKFATDTDYERLVAELDGEKVVDVATADHAARFIRGDAVPAGRYALLRDGGRRVWVLQFGDGPSDDGNGDALSEDME